LLVGHYGIGKNKVCLIWNKNSRMGQNEQKIWAKSGWPDVVINGNTDKDITSAFTAAKKKADAVVVSSDPYLTGHMDTVVAAANDATTKQLVVCYPFPVYQNAKPVPKNKYSMIYGPDLADAYQQVGNKAGIILAAVKSNSAAPDTGLDPGTTIGPIYVGE
jgi:hypothetical protein